MIIAEFEREPTRFSAPSGPDQRLGPERPAKDSFLSGKPLLFTLVFGFLGLALKGDGVNPEPFAGVVEGSCRMEASSVWGGSAIRQEDVPCCLFASRWPKKLGMRHWVVNSKIDPASSRRAEGIYRFDEVVSPLLRSPRSAWDPATGRLPDFTQITAMWKTLPCGRPADDGLVLSLLLTASSQTQSQV